mmetsp:Transcript_46673/g.110994  ORF Transcript_46673/g.110994 Transcript_46673/m.110994 type:complete len:159 (+) Transcript_46673:52-528(+)
MRLSHARACVALFLCARLCSCTAAKSSAAGAEEDQIAWSAGSVLGLQRHFVVRKAPAAEQTAYRGNSESSLLETSHVEARPMMGASVLGLQRGVRLSKTAQLQEDSGSAPTMSFAQENATQRYAAKTSNSASKPAASVLGLQRNLQLRRVTAVVEEEE